eukprot:SAG31_NODE_3634_length_4036_cov_10.699517_4_plen_72_part_00
MVVLLVWPEGSCERGVGVMVLGFYLPRATALMLFSSSPNLLCVRAELLVVCCTLGHTHTLSGSMAVTIDDI